MFDHNAVVFVKGTTIDHFGSNVAVQIERGTLLWPIQDVRPFFNGFLVPRRLVEIDTIQTMLTQALEKEEAKDATH